MHPTHQKEQFSIAYVRAVAAAAGFKIYRENVDDDGIDIGFSQSGAQESTRSPRCEAQIKCTELDVLREETLNYALEVKNYEKLRGNTMVPRILVVLKVPENISDWIQLTEDELAMRNCAYWISLKGRPETNHTSNITINIPRTQIFSPGSLTEIMNKIDNEEEL